MKVSLSVSISFCGKDCGREASGDERLDSEPELKSEGEGDVLARPAGGQVFNSWFELLKERTNKNMIYLVLLVVALVEQIEQIFSKNKFF